MAQETLLIISTIILLLPLFGFTVIIFFGKRLGGGFCSVFETSLLGIGLALSAFVAYYKLVTFSSVSMIQTKLQWIFLGTQTISVGIGIDNMTALMLIVVNLISFLVHLFSIEYMRGDRRYGRYFAYLGIFTFSMLGIVLANNFLIMYIFWELVGFSSYLLIGFWYEKDSAANAGKKAFITNRIGDLGFLIGILIMLYTYRTFMFDDIFAQMSRGIIPFDSGAMLTLAGILIFCGAIGKSAQFPLHVWLPDAMEGPTPVSALIHAATMVAAGVYLTARVFPIFSANALMFIAYIGGFTAFMSATIAITQTDFKRILAYSTVSQLGYMVMGLGVGAFTMGFFHLVTHAWFKACLFLASGSVIHAIHHSMNHANNHSMDPQDIRNMGGLRKTMPLTYLTFLMATIAISGIPLTSGFLSKDGILAGTLAFGTLTGHWLIPVFGFGAAGMTAFYMFRLTIEAFHGKPKTDIAGHTKENNWIIVFPLVLLSVLSFWFFYSFNPIDASSGWFYKNVPPPATAVPAKYQWDFLLPYQTQGQGSHDTSVLAENTKHIGDVTGTQQHGKTPEAAVAPHEIPTASEHGAKEDTNVATVQHEASTMSLDQEHETSAIALHTSEAGSSGHGGSVHHGFNKFEEEMHKSHYPAMILSLCIAGFGMLLAFGFYQLKIFNADNFAKQIYPVYKFSKNKWFFDELYDKTAIGFTVGFAKVSAWFDNTIIDGIVNLTAAIMRVFSYFIGHFDNIIIDGIVNLIANIVGFFGATIRKVQTGSVQTYITLVIIGIMVLLYFVL